MRNAQALLFSLAVCLPATAQTTAPENTAPTANAPRLELLLHRPLINLINDPETELAPFTTDGCSGGMSDGWVILTGVVPALAAEIGTTPPWEPCCVTHDQAYHAAGNATTPPGSALARLRADAELRACVLGWAEPEATRMNGLYQIPEAQILLAYDALANAMYNAVRLGGAPCSIWSWRWGYGYPECSVLD